MTAGQWIQLGLVYFWTIGICWGLWLDVKAREQAQEGEDD